MSDATVDEALAHVHFAKTCFNRAWTLIEKTDRSAADDEQMILLNQASLWHWMQRPDCSDRNLAIGFWQASRIRALVGHGDEATRYARLALDHGAALSPFYVACGHEAMARAAQVRGDRDAARAHAAKAHALVPAIDDVEERDLIAADLASLA